MSSEAFSFEQLGQVLVVGQAGPVAGCGLAQRRGWGDGWDEDAAIAQWLSDGGPAQEDD